MEKTNLMRRIERDYGATLDTIIRGYLAQGYSRTAIAAVIDVNYYTLRNWMNRLGIKGNRNG